MEWELRHDLRLTLECPVQYVEGGHVGQGRLVNLSTGGWQIAGARGVSPGAPLKLRVELPDGRGPMEVQLATVRWSSGTIFGLKNMILGEDEWKRLRRFVIDHAGDAHLITRRRV